MPQIKTETTFYLYFKSKIKNSWNNTWYIDRSRFAKKFGNSRFIRGQSANFFSVQGANQFLCTVLSIIQAGIKDGIGKSFMLVNDLFIFNGTAITIFMSFIAVWIIENSLKFQKSIFHVSQNNSIILRPIDIAKQFWIILTQSTKMHFQIWHQIWYQINYLLRTYSRAAPILWIENANWLYNIMALCTGYGVSRPGIQN